MKTNNTWVDEFHEKLDELGRKNKKHEEELKKLRKKSKQIDAELIGHLKEKYGGGYGMTENKRFDFNLIFGEDEYTGTVFDNGKILKTTDVVYLLNKLSEENDWLKKEIESLKDINARCCNEYSYFHKRMMKLEKENDELKSTNMEMEDYLGRLEEQIKELEKENQEMNKK